MNTRELLRLGVPEGEPLGLAREFIRDYIARGLDGALLRQELAAIVAGPEAYFDDDLRGPLARAIHRPPFTPRAEPAPWRQWGADLETEAVKQMSRACQLPVAVAGEDVILDIENHHNFAWRETHVVNGEARELIVHRKGATPAGAGVLGIIPGSMATPGYVVRGRGSAESLHSASHGAGRTMSRTKAMQSFTWSAVKKQLAAAGVELLSAGLDEVPGVYKDIAQVMAAQADLVEILGRFDPKLVKMCPAGEKAED